MEWMEVFDGGLLWGTGRGSLSLKVILGVHEWILWKVHVELSVDGGCLPATNCHLPGNTDWVWLYGGPAAEMRQCHLNNTHFYYYYYYLIVNRDHSCKLLSFLKIKTAFCSLYASQATDGRTDKQTDRWKASSRKAPAFVSGSLTF